MSIEFNTSIMAPASLDAYMNAHGEIDAPAVSQFCSRFITVQDEEATLPSLEIFKQIAAQSSLKVDITIDLSTVWYGMSAAIEKIEAAFGKVHSITFVKSSLRYQDPFVRGLRNDFYLEIPSTVKKLILKNVEFLPLRKMCKKVTDLEELRVLGARSEELCEEILLFPYPKTFRYLEAQISARDFSRYMGAVKIENGVVKFFQALHGAELGMQNRLELLRKSLDCLPNFLQAQIWQARFDRSSESQKVLEESVKLLPGDSFPHFALGVYLLRESPIEAKAHLDRALELIIEEKNVDGLLSISMLYHDEKLGDMAYNLLNRETLSRESVIEYLKRILVIDPTHKGALLELLMMGVPEGSSYINHLLSLEVASRDISHIVVCFWACAGNLEIDLTEYGLSEEEAERAQKVLAKLSSCSSTLDWLLKIADFFVKQQMPLDTLFSPWIHFWNPPEYSLRTNQENVGNIARLYGYLSKMDMCLELQEKLVDLIVKNDVTDKHKFRFARLCVQIERGEEDGLAERIQEHIQLIPDYRTDAMELFFLLTTHSRLPKLRIQVLEEVIGDKVSSDSDFARLLLAELLLSEDPAISQDVPRAKKLIQQQLQRLLESDNVNRLVFCEKLLEEHNIFPVARKAIMDRLITLAHARKERLQDILKSPFVQDPEQQERLHENVSQMTQTITILMGRLEVK